MTGALQILKFDSSKSIKIGRGSDSDVRISDISVSRVHSYIESKEDGFYIKDNTSKFGTLLRIKDKVTMDGSIINSSHPIQYGRTIISMSFTKDNNFA